MASVGSRWGSTGVKATAGEASRKAVGRLDLRDRDTISEGEPRQRLADTVRVLQKGAVGLWLVLCLRLSLGHGVRGFSEVYYYHAAIRARVGESAPLTSLPRQVPSAAPELG